MHTQELAFPFAFAPPPVCLFLLPVHTEYTSTRARTAACLSTSFFSGTYESVCVDVYDCVSNCVPLPHVMACLLCCAAAGAEHGLDIFSACVLCSLSLPLTTSMSTFSLLLPVLPVHSSSERREKRTEFLIPNCFH